jgi:ATP-dependent protease ClpP protease subunit
MAELSNLWLPLSMMRLAPLYFMAHIVNIDGVVGWDVTADSVRDQLAKAKGEPIEVQVSSPGGSVFSGISIFNLIKNYKGEKSTKIIGLAASMGSYIALATDHVAVEENAVYMVHNASGISWGDHRELRKTAKTLEGLSNLLGRKYEAKTGKSAEEITALMDDETWLFGQEIVDNGFADEVVEADDGEAESKEEILAFAKLRIEDCNAKLKSLEKEDDLEKIAAMLKTETDNPHLTQNQINNIINDISTPKGAVKMTPEEIEALKAENAKLKAEAEAAKVEPVVEEPTTETPGVCAQALNVLKSDAYPAQAKDIAAQVLEGKASEDTLKAVVAIIDMQAESAKSEEAKLESKNLEDTPAGQAPQKSESGIPEAAATVKDFLSKTKGGTK